MSDVPASSDGLGWRARYEGAAGRPLTVPGREAEWEAGRLAHLDAARRWWAMRWHGATDYGVGMPDG